ncbi:outer membrane beta-barrel protein [Undibacterium sp. CY18W]|uniref:Outer membrane beta-barrel protein n=1 Tax=Undibacterium hunanense TaxID=2762292 RepID=A0ABR6ZU56_9BURK|nr:OmpW family outer membrane protein [Undibacterium hunanense]MBC3919415.1 outer membrane beta-barrel protein [Undibacterium hunanense]
MKKIQIAIAVALGLASVSAMAYDNTVRAGIINVQVHSESPDFTSNGPAFLTPQPAGLTVGNATTVLLGYTRRLNDNFDFDFLAGIPPEHDVKGRGTLAPYGTIAKVKQRAPTFFINYNFGAPTNAWRPYVGLGFNYTQFFDATSTAVGNIATGGPTKIDLKDSFGLAGQVGISYKFSDRWSVNASIAAADVKTDMKATTGSIERKTTINFRPVVYGLCVGYSF